MKKIVPGGLSIFSILWSVGVLSFSIEVDVGHFPAILFLDIPKGVDQGGGVIALSQTFKCN